MMLFDPILRGPVFGSMLMCLAASLMGAFLFVRKRVLIGETLSHATYPGVILGAFLGGVWGSEEWMSAFILIGGFLSALLASFALTFFQNRIHLKSDSALCVILTSFFGVGVLLASLLQAFYPKELKSIQGYLYGQVATMGDFHIFLYGALACLVLGLILLFYKELKTLSFDPEFFFTLGKAPAKIDALFLFLVVLSTVIGIRSVGVIMMSAMLIAPSIGARQFTQSLSMMLILSSFFALFSAFLGTYLSFRAAFPTGPLIVIIASSIALGALLFAPERGIFPRSFRIASFRFGCLKENLLKAIWKRKQFTFKEIKESMGVNPFTLYWILLTFRLKGFLEKKENLYLTTLKGISSGDKIVRLHRLWEVYLVTHLGMGIERVHKSAEEMEHILTPELERELTFLLNNPKHDPHDQPIPEGR